MTLNEGSVMAVKPLVPVDRGAQRLTEQQWQAAMSGQLSPASARPIVRASWERARSTNVSPSLSRAPLALGDDALSDARERVDWLPFARRAVDQLHGSYGIAHVLTMFNARGHMLAAEGDASALEGLADINFRPGGDWSETLVGTNGPGTALALGVPVHIVGDEHFCERWQAWHCAAVPLRDQVTGAMLGVLDVSGHRDFAHPHSLDLVAALGIAIEQMLAARDVERRYLVIHRLMELSGRYPGDTLVAVDRAGTVLFAAGAVPERVRTDGALPELVRRAVALAVHDASDAAPRDLVLSVGDRGVGDRGAQDLVSVPAVCFPVLDGLTGVGACVLLRQPTSAPRERLTKVTRTGTVAAVRGAERAERAEHGTRYSFCDLVGQSPGLAEACRIAGAAASNTLPVLLTGESGTGKEVFAQSIHRASVRREKPFVAVNCASLPRELIESELFGYVGGAFSGSRRDGSPGHFVAADGGTIFLDEIGELTPAAQAALLRVLQEGEVTPVGSTRSRRVDVRVIAATNRDVAASLGEGRLREDLYYRLDVLRIHLPPLRERRGDVSLLARRFLAAAGIELGRPGHTFAPDVLDLLERHRWPGNVRELKNVVRRLVALCPTTRITRADLSDDFLRAVSGDGPGKDPGAGTRRGQNAPTDEAFGATSKDSASPRRDEREASAAPEGADDPDRARTMDAVSSTRTMTDAARLLGITRSTLYRRLERYGLHTGRVVYPGA